MTHEFRKARTEADCLKDDANDPLLAMLDDENVSIEEIFETFGIPPVPADLIRGVNK